MIACVKLESAASGSWTGPLASEASELPLRPPAIWLQTADRFGFDIFRGNFGESTSRLKQTFYWIRQVHLKSQFIMNGVCVVWRGWLDLCRLDGTARLEYDHERARVSDNISSIVLWVAHKLRMGGGCNRLSVSCALFINNAVLETLNMELV